MGLIKDKWKIIKNIGKRNYIIYRVILQRMIILAIILSILSGFFNYGAEFFKQTVFYIKGLFVIISYSLLGILIGNLEWNFYKAASNDELTEKAIKKYYSIIYGILGFGVPLWFVNAVFDYKSFIGNIISLIIWIIIGYLYGVWTYKKVLDAR